MCGRFSSVFWPISSQVILLLMQPDHFLWDSYLQRGGKPNFTYISKSNQGRPTPQRPQCFLYCGRPSPASPHTLPTAAQQDSILYLVLLSKTQGKCKPTHQSLHQHLQHGNLSTPCSAGWASSGAESSLTGLNFAI